MLIKVQADFSQVDPSLNQCVLKKKLLVAGGDDSKVKVYAMNEKYDSCEQTYELVGPTMPVTGVDISDSLSTIAATSKDGFAYIFDVQTKSLIDKVSFKCKPESKNMIMRACTFREETSLYTLCT